MLKYIVFAVATLLLAIYYSKSKYRVYDNLELNELEKKITQVWETKIKQPSSKFQKLSVGVNGNLDVIVDGVQLLKKLKISPGRLQNHAIINNLQELQETFHHFFTQGSAAERIFSDPVLYEKITKIADGIDGAEYYIGGNAALMATTTSVLFPNVKIQFVGPIGPRLLKMMPNSITIPENSHISHDEVHLIMEYKVGERWGDSTANVATRFITSYDESNSKVTMLETFFQNVQDFKPDLVLLSGLHLLDGETDEFFRKRVDTFTAGVGNIPNHVPVHLELASMANKQFVQHILQKVLPTITSLGLNEQELFFSSYAVGGPHAEEFHNMNGQPMIHRVSDIILWLLKTYGYSDRNPNSRLTRIHFHSLTYHIAGVNPSVWSNIESGMMAGVRVAGLQACNVQTLTPDLVDLRIPLKYQLYSGDIYREFNASQPVNSWTLDGFQFVFSPVLVCKEPVKTVGLGDAISATGLMYSQFNSPNR